MGKSKIEGFFVDGNIQGEATITFQDGSKYTGACFDNMMNGFG